jgi:hypothetical protein
MPAIAAILPSPDIGDLQGFSPASRYRKQIATVRGNEPFTMMAECAMLQR